jgi:hypothetical protein
VAACQTRLRRSPDNKALVAARADLLRQVGLKAAAAGPQPGS